MKMAASQVDPVFEELANTEGGDEEERDAA